MSKGNPRLVDYDTYSPALRDIVMTVFVAVQAPELVSRDLRSRVLPLYFARPIKTIDYPLAKYLAFTGACLVMMEVPLLLLYVGSIANVHGGSAVWAQTRALVPGLLVGLMWAVVLAAISLFLASTTGRRAFATGAVAIALLLTFTLAEILLQVEGPQNQGPQAVAVKGSGPGAPTYVHPVLYVPSLAEKVSGLFSPFTLFDGVRMWLGGTDPADGVPNPGGFGAVYALVLVVITALCLYGLAARYRKARLS
jgi:ABC-2 type transport system permease protein